MPMMVNQSRGKMTIQGETPKAKQTEKGLIEKSSDI